MEPALCTFVGASVSVIGKGWVGREMGGSAAYKMLFRLLTRVSRANGKWSVTESISFVSTGIVATDSASRGSVSSVSLSAS